MSLDHNAILKAYPDAVTINDATKAIEQKMVLLFTIRWEINVICCMQICLQVN